MSGNRSVNVGRDSLGNAIATGDNNRVNATINVRLTKVELPAASSVDIAKELVKVRTVFEQVGGEHTAKIARALDDAAEEAQKPNPDKDEIGAALERAIEYAKKSNAFAEEASKLAPYVTNAVAWLGSNWHKLLPLVGLAL